MQNFEYFIVNSNLSSLILACKLVKSGYQVALLKESDDYQNSYNSDEEINYSLDYYLTGVTNLSVSETFDYLNLSDNLRYEKIDHYYLYFDEKLETVVLDINEYRTILKRKFSKYVNEIDYFIKEIIDFSKAIEKNEYFSLLNKYKNIELKDFIKSFVDNDLYYEFIMHNMSLFQIKTFELNTISFLHEFCNIFIYGVYKIKHGLLGIVHYLENYFITYGGMFFYNQKLTKIENVDDTCTLIEFNNERKVFVNNLIYNVDNKDSEQLQTFSYKNSTTGVVENNKKFLESFLYIKLAFPFFLENTKYYIGNNFNCPIELTLEKGDYKNICFTLEKITEDRLLVKFIDHLHNWNDLDEVQKEKQQEYIFEIVEKKISDLLDKKIKVSKYNFFFGNFSNFAFLNDNIEKVRKYVECNFQKNFIYDFSQYNIRGSKMVNDFYRAKQIFDVLSIERIEKNEYKRIFCYPVVAYNDEKIVKLFQELLGNHILERKIVLSLKLYKETYTLLLEQNTVSILHDHAIGGEDLTIRTTSRIFDKVFRKEISFYQALELGLLKVYGDLESIKEIENLLKKESISSLMIIDTKKSDESKIHHDGFKYLGYSLLNYVLTSVMLIIFSSFSPYILLTSIIILLLFVYLKPIKDTFLDFILIISYLILLFVYFINFKFYEFLSNGFIDLVLISFILLSAIFSKPFTLNYSTFLIKELKNQELVMDINIGITYFLSFIFSCHLIFRLLFKDQFSSVIYMVGLFVVFLIIYFPNIFFRRISKNNINRF